MNSTASRTATPDRSTLRINGVARVQTPRNGSLVIGHRQALNLILAAEAGSDFDPHRREELPAIVSHWLQSPKDTPVLLAPSYRDKWLDMLRNWCLLDGCTPAAGLPKRTSHPRPVHIDFSDIPFPPVERPKFTFIDLFAGIGGFRTALQDLGGKCVFSSEWDRHAKETYFQNYGEVPFGDIKSFTGSGIEGPNWLNAVPQHDILAGGFPCQAFSQAGKQLGFNDARGTLFFDILRIIEARRPKALILENVKRLRGHDGGRTFAVILNSLKELKYKVYSKVLRACDFALPQNRERIFIVAFPEPLHFSFPEPVNSPTRVGDILEPEVDAWFTISDRIYEGHKRRVREHRARGNGFGFSVFRPDAPYTNTISARYWKDGSEILIDQGECNPRMLTPRECARIQGFSDEFQTHASRRHAYQQFGNSVPVPVVKAVASQVAQALQYKRPAQSPSDPFEAVNS
jgi:DNA (cytosine-5)-methyltransferase 1